MDTRIEQIDHHMVGHCDCCDGYRALEYYDRELGYLCFRCIDHLMVADIELNHGGYTLCRPALAWPMAGQVEERCAVALRKLLAFARDQPQIEAKGRC